MKPTVMHLVTTLDMGGAERLSLAIIQKNKEHFHGIVASLYGTDGDLARCADAMEIQSMGLNASGGRLKSIITLYKALRKHNVSLLHVQAGYLLLFAFPAAKLAGVRLIYTEHALHSIQKYVNIRRGIRFFAPFIQGISCVNEEIKNFFVNTLQVSSSKVEVIENGVDTTLFSPSGEKAQLSWQAHPSEDLFVFGTVARLTEAKDHPNLLTAFSLLEKKYPQIRLLMVGDGEERERTEKLIKELQLNDKVHITGKALDIPERLRSMQVFVMSSQREGLPVAILEAMACGLPIISTDVGSIASLDDKGSRISLVPPQDAHALAHAMEELIINPRKKQSLAEQGRAYILAEKSDINMAKAYLAMYKQGGLACPS